MSPKKQKAVVTLPKTGRPAQGDKADKRCAFVYDKRCRAHNLGPAPAAHWCDGCGFYVCPECDSMPDSLAAKHDVVEHELGEGDIEDEDDEYGEEVPDGSEGAYGDAD